MATNKKDKTVAMDNLIHATVEHKRGNKRPKVSFGFVAKGLLLTGAFLMGMSPVSTVYAQSITSNNFTTSVTSVHSTISDNQSYTEMLTKLVGDLNYSVGTMNKATARNSLSAKNIQAIGVVLSKMENAINNGAIIVDENTLIDALKGAESSVYLDTEKWGTQFGNDVLSAKKDVESKISDIYKSINYDAGVVGQGDMGKVVVEANSEMFGEKLKDILMHSTINCIHPKNTQGMVFEQQVQKRYDEALKEGLHTETCIVNLSSLYKDNKYTDVKSNVWYFNSVKDLYQVKLMQGETNDKFNPNGNITVAQTIAVASRINALYSTGSLDILEDDYKGSKWYDGVVKYAIDNGIIQASDFSSGDMNKPATRGELCYILYGSIPESEMVSINTITVDDVEDVTVRTKYSDSIMKSINSGIITGYESGDIKPNNKITRAEASCIIDRIVRPTERIKQESNKQENTNGGKVVYVSPRSSNGTQSVYDKASSGLTPITVKYGRHTYLSNNQKEYDLVIGVVEDMLQFEGKAGKTYKEKLNDWKNDTKLRQRMMVKYERLGITNESEAYELYKLEVGCSSARAHGGSREGKNIDSAYELLTLGKGDCTATAMLNMAVMDALGYNSKTVANDSKNHEWVMVQINGKWYHNYGVGLEKESTHTYNRVTTLDTLNNAK